MGGERGGMEGFAEGIDISVDVSSISDNKGLFRISSSISIIGDIVGALME